MRTLTSDASAALRRALQTKLAPCGVFVIEEMRSRSWASVTFEGARHELALRLMGDNARPWADSFLSSLEVEEFALRGHILADLVAVGRDDLADGDVRIRLEALTVQED